MTRRRQGQAWERQAEAWLGRQGLNSLGRNFNCRLGELDLVMADRDTVVFVEVKYRGPSSRVSGTEAITPQKQLRLSRAAGMFLNRHPALARRPCRFDVVAIESDERGPRFLWIRNAFESAVS